MNSFVYLLLKQEKRFLNGIQKIHLLFIVLVSIMSGCSEKSSHVQPDLGFRNVALIEVEGLQFKDLNRNGQLDVYEDWRLTSDERSQDLLSKMSLEEKAGFMIIYCLFVPQSMPVLQQ